MEKGKVIYKEGKYLGETTNNQAEYSGLLEGIKYALKTGIKRLIYIWIVN